jgi:hypothetical protein
MENWSALRNYFDKSTWKELDCDGDDIEKLTIIAFPCEYKDKDTMVSKWIPVDKYEKSGSTKTMVNENYIKQINQYEPK